MCVQALPPVPASLWWPHELHTSNCMCNVPANGSNLKVTVSAKPSGVECQLHDRQTKRG